MTAYTLNETAVYAKYVRWCGRTGPRGPSYPIDFISPNSRTVASLTTPIPSRDLKGTAPR
jgi:hypothetical protein